MIRRLLAAYIRWQAVRLIAHGNVLAALAQRFEGRP